MNSIKDRLTNLTTYRVRLENVIGNLSQVENEMKIQEEKKKQLEAAQASQKAAKYIEKMGICAVLGFLLI